MNEIEMTNEINKPNVDGQIAVNERYGFSRLASYEGFLRSACEFVRQRNEKWWRDLHTNEPIERNVGELLMLLVSETAEAGEDSPEYSMVLMQITKHIARAMEGHRKSKMDDKIPHRTMFEVELADIQIRLMDLAGGLNIDLAGAWRDKMEYNATRKDHTREARLEPDGKKY